MPWWVRRNGTSRKTSPRGAEALSDVDARLNVLEHKEASYAATAARYRADAAERGADPRRRREALNLLRQAAMYDQTAESMQMQRLNLEQQRLALDVSSTNAETVQAQRTMVAASAAVQAAVDPDNVHDLMTVLDEQQDTMREVGDALATPSLSFGAEADDFEDELAALLGAAPEADAALRAALPAANAGAAVAVPYLGPSTHHLAEPVAPPPVPPAAAAAQTVDTETDALLAAFG